jgi:cell division protein FtsN
MNKIIFTSLIGVISSLTFTSCKKNPEIPEVEPMFQTKKRPPYNEVVLSKIKNRENDPDYQEVNPNFANEYQDAQREFEKAQSTQDIIKTQSKSREYEPLTIQKIRQDTAQTPTQPIIEVQPSQTQSTTQSVQSNEIFEIQAGVFRNESSAQQVLKKFTDAKINARIEKINDANTVRITGEKPFTSKSEASKYMQEVMEKTQHYDIMIVRK